MSSERQFMVPFEYYDSRILIDVKLNGRGPYKMMLDTGNCPGEVYRRVTGTMSLDRHIRFRENVTTGEQGPVTYIPFCVESGNLVLEKIWFLEEEVFRLPTGERTLDGILGSSFLENTIVEVDYPGRTLKFHEESPLRPDVRQARPSLQVFPLILDPEPIPRIDVSVNGAPVRAVIDTGFQRKVVVTPLAVEHLGLQVQAEAGVSDPAHTAQGMFLDRRRAELRGFQLGALNLDIDDALYKIARVPPLVGLEYFGIQIGNQFMQDYVVTLDYINKLVGFEPIA